MTSTTPADEIFAAYDDLTVPSEFANYDDLKYPDTIVHLETWKRKAYVLLSSLRDDLRAREVLDSRTQAKVTWYVAGFDGEDPWVLEDTRELARDILSSFITPTSDTLERVLCDFVKPVFQSNPHPLLNAETGRKLPRPAGGPLGHLDYLEGQEWKAYPALSNVLSWCISHTDSRSVEKLWHLYIPPVMTFLDDHQAQYKLRGVRLASLLLLVAPPDLLRRTGIDTLLFNSFKTCLSFLHNPETPDLIRAAVTASVQLTELTTVPASSTRFDQLCSVLGDSIIGNIWVYASREPGTLQASVDVIPAVVRALGIGAARYLKALIPQLTFPLVPAPEKESSFSYQLSSVRALQAVMKACAPRIYKWRGMVLEAVLKCWTDLADSDEVNGCAELKSELRSTCLILKTETVCEPVASEVEAEYLRIRELNVALFGPLLQPSASMEVSA
ncbi:hypothetical protein L226DRAFT_613398 [Lentinus tigrinus ALCF2SS1-7]|uniref:Uncharacterized protein n=1 Tax=Lentinus tigrinus ALCF2SS1-6 TaxID=1328759 RepID=A0A5C2SFU6_9APHY|nr:hypothetical protein L227DRAFT_592653 [Lentinus tigrinus ALCF2SS1-6]RPD74571.1 hypothetical protein L226DRAFT_613398 [Lentinus tigrinus ALCF2SS1-7]